MKKGQLSSIGKVIIALMIAGILIYFIIGVVNKAGKANEDLEDLFGTKLLQLKLEYGVTDEGDVCAGITREDSIRIIREAASMIDDHPFDDFDDFLLAIASVESEFDHCRDGEVLQADGSTALGLMQILEGTAEDYCGGSDISNVVNNALCGALVVKGKHRDIVEGDYESKVRNNCDNPELQEDYLNYNEIERTARAYNSLDCEDADPEYVKNVMESLNQKPWTKI